MCKAGLWLVHDPLLPQWARQPPRQKSPRDESKARGGGTHRDVRRRERVAGALQVGDGQVHLLAPRHAAEVDRKRHRRDEAQEAVAERARDNGRLRGPDGLGI